MKRSGCATLLLAIGLAGCTSGPLRPVASIEDFGPTPGVDDCRRLDDAARMRLVVIEDELQAGHPRAALAYLDALPESLGTAPKAIYLRAEAYRAVAEYEQAGSLYQELSDGCIAGAGYHGLGLIAVAQQDLDTALKHLHRARMYLSTDPKVRNDYGYALLLTGRVAEARVEFETVLELSDRQTKAAGNLILAMLVEGKEQEALHYARAMSFGDARLEQLRRHADVLRENR